MLAMLAARVSRLLLQAGCGYVHPLGDSVVIRLPASLEDGHVIEVPAGNARVHDVWNLLIPMPARIVYLHEVLGEEHLQGVGARRLDDMRSEHGVYISLAEVLTKC